MEIIPPSFWKIPNFLDIENKLRVSSTLVWSACWQTGQKLCFFIGLAGRLCLPAKPIVGELAVGEFIEPSNHVTRGKQMDLMNVNRKSLETLVKQSVIKHDNFVPYQNKHRWFAPRVVEIVFERQRIVRVRVQVEVRFGVDVAKEILDLGQTIRKNMLEMVGLTVGQIKIDVMDVYYD